MASCCEDKSCEITALRIKHRRVLQIVLAVNIVMFAVEGIFGWLAHSTSLLADSLDMFGDATVYAMSLYVLARSQRAQGAVALVKGAINKLLKEKPAIAGISVPGMPGNSPGMGKMKKGTLTVYTIPKGGETPKVFSVE